MRWGLEGQNGDAVADCEAVTAAVEREGVPGGSLTMAESGSFSQARSRAPSLGQRTANNISVLSAFPFPSVGSEMEAQIPSATGPGMPAVGDSEAAYGPYLPASEVFTHGPASADSFLSFYRSSTGVLRRFCGRCGTCLTHVCHHGGGGEGEVLDLMLGTVDRGDLEGSAGREDEEVRAGGEGEWRYNLEPDMHLWWGRGIEWVKRIVGEGGKDKEGGDVGEGGEGEKGGASGEGLFELDGAYMGEERSEITTGLGEMGIEDGARVDSDGLADEVREGGDEDRGGSCADQVFDDMLALIRQGG